MEQLDLCEEKRGRRRPQELRPQEWVETARIRPLIVKLAAGTPALAALLLLLLCATAPSRATTLIYKDFDTLVAEATGIVEGTVSDLEAVQSGRVIHTFITLSDLKLHKGQYTHRSLTLMQLGGRVGRRGHRVAGAPSFAKGDRVIAFVRGNGRAWVPFVGWEQGVFRIESAAGSRERLVTDAAGNRVLGVEGATVVKERRAPPQAEIVRRPGGAGGSGLVRSVVSPPPEGAWVAGGTGLREADNPAADLPPMRYEAFVAAIRHRVARLGPSHAAAAAGPFESAKRSDALRSRPLKPQPFSEDSGRPADNGDGN